MKAAVKKMGDVTVISIEGVLEIEHTQPFRQICLKKFIGEKLVFNMKSANFVGSTGLQSFLDTVKTLDSSNSFGLKVVGAKPEFRRLLANIETQKLTFFEEVNAAVLAFTQPPPTPEPILPIAPVVETANVAPACPVVTPVETPAVTAMTMAPTEPTQKLET